MTTSMFLLSELTPMTSVNEHPPEFTFILQVWSNKFQPVLTSNNRGIQPFRYPYGGGSLLEETSEVCRDLWDLALSSASSWSWDSCVGAGKKLQETRIKKKTHLIITIQLQFSFVRPIDFSMIYRSIQYLSLSCVWKGNTQRHRETPSLTMYVKGKGLFRLKN